MWKDPVVEEVRLAGEKIAEECGYDLHAMAQLLKQKQGESSQRISRKDDLRSGKSTQLG